MVLANRNTPLATRPCRRLVAFTAIWTCLCFLFFRVYYAQHMDHVAQVRIEKKVVELIVWKFIIHTMQKNEKNPSHLKIFRQINYLVISFVKMLVSRNFCQKSARVNFCKYHTALCFRNFHTVQSSNIISRKLRQIKTLQL